jgi:hypothetical protein
MNTQIAIPIDRVRKTNLIRNLKSKWLTTKAFIIFCIDAFNNWDLNLWIIPYSNRDSLLTPQERKEHLKAISEFEKGEYDSLDTVMEKA